MCIAGRARPASIFVLVLLSLCGFSSRAGAGFDNPAVGSPVRADGDCAVLYNQLETEHFILKWTDSSPHPEDNINDPEIVRETAGYLETARDKLTGLFGREPYVPPGSRKIVVLFKDLDCYAYADPPEGPIELNASVWTRMPSVRQTTAAHELFHKFQYAYGYKTRWPPGQPVQWLTEGTAAWAEVFVWGRVSRDRKMEDMFKDTTLDLYDAEDMALPFWIYFVSGNRSTPKNHLMVEFFEKYEQTEKAKEALFDVIRKHYGSVDGFFSRFAKARKNGFWQEPSSDCFPLYLYSVPP